MAIDYKILGQSAPTSTSNADLYAVTAGRTAIVSTISVTNTTTSPATYRIFIRKATAGTPAAAAASNALVYDATVNANDFIAVTVGVTLAASDTISVQSGTANALTFQVFGSEVY